MPRLFCQKPAKGWRQGGKPSAERGGDVMSGLFRRAEGELLVLAEDRKSVV